MPDRDLSRRAKILAGAYTALSAANTVSVARGFRAGEWATKPFLMPTLAAFTLAAARDRDENAGLPVAGMLLGGLGDTALLAAEGSDNPDLWFLPGMGFFAAGHACYIAALVKDGAAGRVSPKAAAGYGAAGALLMAGLWSRLGDLRIPVAAYSAILLSMAVLASGRNRQAAAGGMSFVLSDSLIAGRLAEIPGVPGESVVMPTYVAAQALLAAGWLRPQDETGKPAEQ
jgi:uncharacterized membrane protein YhhN